ncbi:MAG: hypothetical protein ACXAD7_04310 [Candidatus Kariarchaeaceae archaeon]|jgi:hypothetical protein
MESSYDDAPKNVYRRVSYLCSSCNTKRDVIVDQSMHLSREELKKNGLASYIDIHEDFNTEREGEHGTKLFVDTHFHVRSNHPMVKVKNIQASQQTKKLPGLPLPKVSINNQKILYNSISWNSLEISSQTHNIGFFLINPEPSQFATDNRVINVNSPLDTVNAKITFQESKLSRDFLKNSLEWISNLVKWIELTASLNIVIVPSVLFYIDIHHVRAPSVSDELVLSIMIDASAQILLRHFEENLEDIIGIESNFPYKKDSYFPLLGLNMEAFKFVSSQLELREYQNIITIVHKLQDLSTVPEQYVSTFVHLFFDLFRNNSLDYRVSYLL